MMKKLQEQSDDGSSATLAANLLDSDASEDLLNVSTETDLVFGSFSRYSISDFDHISGSGWCRLV